MHKLSLLSSVAFMAKSLSAPEQIYEWRFHKQHIEQRAESKLIKDKFTSVSQEFKFWDTE